MVEILFFECCICSGKEAECYVAIVIAHKYKRCLIKNLLYGIYEEAAILTGIYATES